MPEGPTLTCSCTTEGNLQLVAAGLELHTLLKGHTHGSLLVSTEGLIPVTRGRSLMSAEKEGKEIKNRLPSTKPYSILLS